MGSYPSSSRVGHRRIALDQDASTLCYSAQEAETRRMSGSGRCCVCWRSDMSALALEKVYSTAETDEEAYQYCIDSVPRTESTLMFLVLQSGARLISRSYPPRHGGRSAHSTHARKTVTCAHHSCVGERSTSESYTTVLTCGHVYRCTMDASIRKYLWVTYLHGGRCSRRNIRELLFWALERHHNSWYESSRTL